MATSNGSKFDLSSGSPDGPNYLNGQRGTHGSVSLEKSGSFREGAENHFSSLLPSMSRTGSTSAQGDASNLFQSILSDLKTVIPDHKFPRTAELNRGISSIMGISHEDPIPAIINTKPLPSSSLEELKRMKSNINESFLKARERAKAYGEAVSKIDKYFHPLSKKRSRAEISPNDRSNALFSRANVPKNGPQSHMNMNSLELGPQKMEERAKAGVPNRRVRTSMMEGRMDARANAVSRPSGIPDKDKEMFKLVRSCQAPSEEKGPAPISGVDGWEKPKMKKKRSVIKSDVTGGSVMARPLDSDRESKQVRQKLGGNARSRLNNAHGFRSGPVTGTVGHGKSDIVSQQINPSMRPSPRYEQESSSLSNDRRDRFIGLDKESSILRSAIKLNGHEENQSGSPTPTTKLNTSVRAPRSNPGSLSRASPNTLRAAASPNDWEQSASINKFGSFGGVINRKCSSSQPASPPVAQLSRQRPHKLYRVARRSNLPHGALVHDTFAFSETENSSISEDGSGVARHLCSNTQNKLKNDQKSPASLLDNEDSGLAENKLKAKKFSETEENATQSGQKVTTHILPPRKNKVAAEDDFGDGICRQGRIGQGYTPTSVMSATFEKPENTSLIKQMRSARVCSEKIESKPGRPPTKKFSERKGCTRPRHSVNNACMDSTGEADDDCEELLAAADAVLNTRSACPNLFWKQIERIFGLISAEDIAYLNKQIHLMDEGAASTHVGNGGQSLQDDLGCVSIPSTPALGNKDPGPLSNGTYFTPCERNSHTTSQVKQDEPLLEDLMGGMVPASGVSICQVLLSAIIEEEEVENFYYATRKAVEYSNNDSLDICFDVDAQLSPKGFHMLSSAKIQTAERTYWQENNEMPQDKLGINYGLVESYTDVLSRLGNSLDEYFGDHSMAPDSLCTELQYNQMNISDRILLELSAIGLHPEHVSEEEDIVGSIHSLEEMLHEQVTRKKTLLLRLEKVTTESKEDQQRSLEHIALDKLVGSAYEKYLACWGPNASGGKSANKNTRHATMAFIKRTLAKCQKFDKTGHSCFKEPPFRDMFLSIPSHSIKAESTDNFVDGEAANRFSSLRHSESTLTDLRHSLASHLVQRFDMHDKHSNSLRPVSQISEVPLLNRGKREVLLDDVGSAGTSLRASAGFESSLVSGTKGKRSERDREWRGQNKDTVSRNGNVKIGRPPLSNAKGEQKNKAKPRRRLTQLSTSVNGLLSRTAEAPDTGPKSHGMVGGDANYKEDMVVPSSFVGKQETSNNMEAIDFNLQITELDVADFGGQGQDIGSWLNIGDDEALQDHDFMGGLEIPMDDLSELKMML